MMFKYVLNCLEMFRRLFNSYGHAFIVAATVVSTGADALTATVETLKQEKYKPIMVKFQKTILLLYAAFAEFKAGYIELKRVMAESPEEFKAANDFFKELKTQVPAAFEESFRSPVEHLAAMKAEGSIGNFPLPEFIKNSGEYMDFINVNRKEVSEDEFKKAFLKQYKDFSVAYQRQKLAAISKDLESTGWATLVILNEENEDKAFNQIIIVWADKLDIELPKEYEPEAEGKPATVMTGNQFIDDDYQKS